MTKKEVKEDFFNKLQGEYVELTKIEYLWSLAEIYFNSKEEVKVDYKRLHKDLEAYLRSKTGKLQQRVDKRSFLPNSVDLEHKLSKIIKKYDLKNLETITKLLFRHIDKGVNNQFRTYTVLLKYYIEKDGESELATDYFSFEDIQQEKEQKDFKSTQTFV